MIVHFKKEREMKEAKIIFKNMSYVQENGGYFDRTKQNNSR